MRKKDQDRDRDGDEDEQGCKQGYWNIQIKLFDSPRDSIIDTFAFICFNFIF